MGNSRNTGYLQNIVQYDASNNITLPARLAVTGTVAVNNTTPYDTTQFSLDVNGGLIVKNINKTAQFVLINSNPATGGNNAFVVHTVGGTSGSSYADIQGYYGTSVAGSTVIRLNPQGGNVLVGSLAGTGSRMVVADTTGILSTQAIPTLGELSGVPTSRTLTINGVSYDLSANRSWSALPVGGTAGQLLAKVDSTDYNAQWVNEAPAASYTSQLKHVVKAGAAINKGQAVYVSSSDGTNMIVNKASNASEQTSSKTLGLLETTVSNNGFTNVITEGLLAGLDTTGANAAGDPVWLGTDGNLIYGLLNKPSAPAHLVFIGVVTRRNANNGEIFVKVQNGFEMGELHDYVQNGVQDNYVISYELSTSLYKPKSIATLLGYTPANAARSLTINGTSYDLTADRTWTLTTSNITEGTNLYYTDTRVGTYLTANSYATQSYVGTQIANLVASSPAALDTLNELAAALGNDAAFSTTVSTALGNRLRVDINTQGLSATLQGYGRTNLGLGTAATSNTGDFAAASHTHSIANVTGLQTALDGKQASGSYAAATHSHIISDVTGLQTALDGKQASLGFTPYNSTNPSGYISSYTETDTLASVTGRGATTTTTTTFNNININNDVRFLNSVSYGLSWSGTFGGSPVSRLFDNSQLFLWTDDQTNFATVSTGASADWRWMQGVSNEGVGGSISMRLLNNNLSVTGTISASNLSGTNTGDQTLSGLGGVPTSRTLTINGTAFDLTSDRSWTISGTDSTKLPLAGGTLTGNLLFSNSGTTKRGIQGTVGDNDMWFIGGNATGSNAGFLEISTGDDGQTAGSAEPIYVRQYGPGDPLTGTLFRSASLLDASGNTSFPGTLSASNFSGTHSGSSSGTNTGDQTNISGNAATAGTADYAHQLKWYGAGASVTDANTFQKGILSNYYGGGAISNIPDATYGSLYNFGGYDASSLSLQLFSAVNHNSTSSTRTLFFRMGNNLGFQNDWKTLIDNTSIGAQSVNYATTAGTLSSNATVNGVNFGGVFAMTASGASTSNSTGARLSESYGPIWNLSNSATWHHQVINGSYLCGISAGGGNYGGGNYYGTGDVTAYYSDERLKTKVSTITDAIEKIKTLEGFVYIENDLARSFGYTNEKEQAGVSAQQIQAVLPQAVSLAPFDMQGVPETGEIISKSGDEYLTVKYDRIVPLLIEGIKEQQTQIESQKSEIEELKDLVKQLINR